MSGVILGGFGLNLWSAGRPGRKKGSKKGHEKKGSKKSCEYARVTTRNAGSAAERSLKESLSEGGGMNPGGLEG